MKRKGKESREARDEFLGEDPEGARRATGESSPRSSGRTKPVQRWSAARKREVSLRLLRGESVEALSRELGVEIYRLEQWRQKALEGIDAALRERGGDPLQAELDQALKRIGELSMENELLREKNRVKFPLARGRSRR